MKRTKLPGTRKSVTHKVTIYTKTGNDPDVPVELFLIFGVYSNGAPGELFIKTGNLYKGMYDAFAIDLSLMLQYGIPFKTIYDKHAWQQFEPAGPTDNPEIRIAKSIPDYVVRWMAKRFNLLEETK